MNKIPTVKEWLYKWFYLYSLPNIKPSTAVSYDCYMRLHINPEIGDLPMNELNLEILQNFFNSLSKKLSPKSVLNIRMMLHAALKYAYLNDLIPKNYVEYVIIPKVIKREMRVLTVAEHEKVLNTIIHTDEPYAFGVFLCLTTGIRIGELCALTWENIDFVNEKLKVRKTLQRLMKLEDDGSDAKTMIYIGTPKSEASIRDIPLNDYLLKSLMLHMERMAEKFGNSIISPNEYVITHRINHPVEPKTMQEYFEKVVSISGIKKANFHALRHTFATRALESGIDFKTLSILLGHSSVEVTINRYAHVLEAPKRKAMNEIVNAILSPNEEKE